jgi:carbonic anhydrase
MKASNSRKTIVLNAICVSLLASLSLAQETHHWSYSGDTGPEHWSEVSAVCKFGHAQSPINIVHANQKDLPTLEFSYHPAALNVIDNGHTVQVNYAPGSTLKVGDKTYELVQFHFHHKSETAINGKHSPLEVHLVHKDKDGNLAVVAVLLQEGDPNPAVATTWSNIPAAKEKAVSPEAVEIQAIQLLPANKRYYTYSGSLTTPPCTENVTWLVMVDPVTVSKEQIAKFAKLYPTDERPVQPLYGRAILESK